MPATYVTDAVLLQDVANVLGLPSAADLPARWAPIAADANQMAVGDLTMILVGKGYAQGDVDAWDDRTSFNRKLGLWYALSLGNPLGNYPDKFLENLDPRKLLTDAGAIRVGGVPRAPAVGASDVGGIAYGGRSERDELLADARDRGLFR